MTETLATAYGSDRMGRAFGYRSQVYSTGYHRGQDVRKLHPSGNYSVATEVLSLSAGKVVYVGRPNRLLELTVVVDTAREQGRFESHSHNTDPQVSVGERVKSGTPLATNAVYGERPGTAWAGPHDHFTISDHMDGAWNTTRPVYDPLPFIRAALVAFASIDSRPLEDIMATLDDEDLQKIAKAVWTFEMNGGAPLGSGTVVKSESAGERLRQVRRVTLANREDITGIKGDMGDPASVTDSDIADIAAKVSSSLKSTLPAAVVAEISKRLAS